MKKLTGIILLGLIVSSCSIFQKPSMTQEQIDEMIAENDALKTQVANCKDLEDKLALARMQADDAMLKLANYEGDANSKVHIIVGAFKNSSYANDYSARMKQAGYDGRIIAGPYSFNLVTSGSYGSVKQALSDLRAVRDNVIETAWIYIE
jgi:cell division protein FtsN